MNSASPEFRTEGNRTYSLAQYEDHAASKAQIKGLTQYHFWKRYQETDK